MLPKFIVTTFKFRTDISPPPLLYVNLALNQLYILIITLILCVEMCLNLSISVIPIRVSLNSRYQYKFCLFGNKKFQFDNTPICTIFAAKKLNKTNKKI